MAVESQLAGPPHPAFPAFLAGAGRPLLPSMIDYSVFSQLAAAHASIISGPVSRSAMLSISAFRPKFGLRVIWLSEVRVRWPFPVATPLVTGERPGAVFCWVGFSPLQFSVPKGEACQMAALHPRILIVATAPPPTLGECRHSFLARRLIAVHWPAVFVVALAMVHATDSRLARRRSFMMRGRPRRSVHRI